MIAEDTMSPCWAWKMTRVGSCHCVPMTPAHQSGILQHEHFEIYIFLNNIHNNLLKINKHSYIHLILNIIMWYKLTAKLVTSVTNFIGWFSQETDLHERGIFFLKIPLLPSFLPSISFTKNVVNA